MKIDPWKHKERYLKWKELVREGIPDISKENSDIILRYLKDMEMGLNISAKELNIKGGNKIKIEGGFLRNECLELFE